MSVIPKWAADEAALVVKNFGHDAALIEGAIAGALVKERERCAKIAEWKATKLAREAQKAMGELDYDEWAMLRREARLYEEAAKAIREGHQ